jgi:hypothetical protein
MLAANPQTMLLLKRHVLDTGGRLSRDVIFVANSDEEESGEFGCAGSCKNHRDLIDAEFALNEGGRTRSSREAAVRRRPEHGKGAARRDGHGPRAWRPRFGPLKGNATHASGRALSAIGAHQEPVW